VIAAVELLAEHGPALDRPLVDRVKGSKYHFRVLFIFDPRREAILLIGGDKSGNWDAWYAEAIPEAERLYEEYLDDFRTEGILEETE
jgi:hypothetical protein